MVAEWPYRFAGGVPVYVHSVHCVETSAMSTVKSAGRVAWDGGPSVGSKVTTLTWSQMLGMGLGTELRAVTMAADPVQLRQWAQQQQPDDTALATEDNFPRIAVSIECLAQGHIITTSFAQALEVRPVGGGHCV